MLPKLHYISQGSNSAEHLHNIELALQAGVKLVQLRLKHISEDIYIESAIKAKELCIKHDAQLIINDSPLVAKKSQADGIHLGLYDMKIFKYPIYKYENTHNIWITRDTFDKYYNSLNIYENFLKFSQDKNWNECDLIFNMVINDMNNFNIELFNFDNDMISNY